jgi:hypothetical protein
MGAAPAWGYAAIKKALKLQNFRRHYHHILITISPRAKPIESSHEITGLVISVT